MKKELISDIMNRLELAKQAKMQYKIPQNVQIEDKIVGPLTLRQLIYLGVGGGISYAIYVILAKQYYWEIWLIPTAIPALITLAVTFLKINGIPFGKWVFLMIEYFKISRKRTFVMGGADMYGITLFAEKLPDAHKEAEAQTKAERDRKRLQNIGEISKALDTFSGQTKLSS